MASENESSSSYDYTLNCRKCVEIAFTCATPKHQWTTYYRDGELDDCKEDWGDLFRCLRAKLLKPEEAEAYVEGTRLDKNFQPHRADVWEYKDTPGW